MALAQTTIVADKLKAQFPDIEIEIVTMTTKGDERLDKMLSSFGGKGVFTKELEDGLLDGFIDIAVHSAKDMPMELPEGLSIGAVLERADVRDVAVTMTGQAIRTLPAGAVVGTSSLRRELQIKALNPDITIKPIRGNVQTRLNKLSDGGYDAVILAAAGLTRLNYETDDSFDYRRFKYEFLGTEDVLPAAGQGILAVETRSGEFKHILEAISDKQTWLLLDAERSFLKHIGGSCNAPAAALSEICGRHIKMCAMYAPDGQQLRYGRLTMHPSDAKRLGERIAKQLLEEKEHD